MPSPQTALPGKGIANHSISRILRPMPAIHLHCHTLLLISRKMALAAQTDSKRPHALTDDALLSIVMAAASTEAFVNEFSEYAPLVCGELLSEAILAPLAACADVLREMEESRAPVTSKYLIASLALVGRSFDKGAAPFQDFKLLIDLRNAVMHVRPSFGEDTHTAQRITDTLAQRGLAIAGGPGALDWFDRLMTPAVAAWAHDSAVAIIRGLLELVPVRPYYEPLDMYRRSFLNHDAVGGRS